MASKSLVTIEESNEGPKLRHFLNTQTQNFQGRVWKNKRYYFPFAQNLDSVTMPEDRHTG